MPPAFVNTTLQAAALSGTSNVLAQLIQSYRHDHPFRLDLFQLARFALSTLVLTPPNYFWQQYLERTFPASDTPEQTLKKEKEEDSKNAKQKLNVKNTAAKFLLDMTLGATVNTYLFISVIGILKGKSSAEVFESCHNEFLPLMFAGLKLWPLVSILLFTFVPVEKRIIFGSIVGLFWNIYLSILAA